MKLKPEAFEPCIQKIVQRAGVEGSKAAAMMQETAAKAQTFRERGEADPFGAAARRLAEDLKQNAAKDRSDAARNSMIRNGIMNDIKVNGLERAALTLESAMVNINTRLPSMRAPLEEVGQGLTFRWITATDVELRKIGMDKAWASGALDDQIAEHLFELSRVGPKKPPTDKIGKAAYIINSPLFDSMERLKAAGVRADHAIDYITRTKHDPRPMIDAGYDAWKAKMEERLHPRTFADLKAEGKDFKGDSITNMAEAKENFYRTAYNAIITGVHGIHGDAYSAEGDMYIPPAFEGSRNIAKRHSHERVFYWKDSASWLAHMREFGGMTTLGRTVMETLTVAGRHTALMERFGTNPMGSLNMLIRQVEEHYRDTDPLKVIEFNKKADHLRAVMGQLDGSANIPHNRWVNDMVNNLKNIENMSMLGAVGLTHFAALPMTMSTLGPHYGLSRFELFANNVRALLQGAAPGEGQDILADAGAFHHGTMSHFMSQFRNSPNLTGKMSALAGMTLKMTGINYVLENSQNGFRYLLMHKIGRDISLDHGKIDSLLRDNLHKYGIGEREWQLLQGVRDSMQMAEGRRYATPKDFHTLSDATVDRYNAEPIRKLKQAIEDQRYAHMHADAQEENWLHDRTNKLEETISRWREKIDKWSEQRDIKKSDVWLAAESKVEEMQERIKDAKVSQRIAKHVQSLRTAEEVQGWLNEVRTAMEGERQRYQVEGVADDETEKLFNDIVHEEFKEAGQGQKKAVVEGGHEQESLAVKYGRFLTRSERRIRQYRASAEEKIKGIEAKDDADTKWFTERVADADEQMRQFAGRSEARIWQRAERLEALERAFPDHLEKMRQKTRWTLADNYSAFITHAGKEATVAAGAREKAWAAPVTGTGALGKMMMQFKMWPLAVINQVHGRELYANQSRGAMLSNFGMLLGLSMAGGMFRMMVRDASNGNPIRDPRDPKTMAAALMQGGGVGLFGDFLFGETNRMGGSFIDTLAGPVIGDASKIMKIFMKARDDTFTIGEEVHHGRGAYSDVWPDLLHFTKGHIPMANMLGLKGALDYLVWNHLFEAVSPGYWERTNRRLLKETGRARLGYTPGSSPPSLF